MHGRSWWEGSVVLCTLPLGEHAHSKSVAAPTFCEKICAWLRLFVLISQYKIVHRSSCVFAPLANNTQF